MPHTAQPVTRRRTTTAPVICRRFALTPQFPWDNLVHQGIHFGRVVMCFVEVAGASLRLPHFFCRAFHSHAFHSGARDLQEVCAYSQLPWDYLVHPEIRFGRVFMHFVEVAGVTTRLTAFFSACASQCTTSPSQACHYGSRDLQEMRAHSPTPPGLSCAPGNQFWPRCHAFRGSSRREY